jgi:hypothetical protein
VPPAPRRALTGKEPMLMQAARPPRKSHGARGPHLREDGVPVDGDTTMRAWRAGRARLTGAMSGQCAAAMKGTRQLVLRAKPR